VSTSSDSLPTRKAKAAQRSKALAVEAFGSEHATEAIQQILQPLAQLMVGHSVQLGTIVEMLKKALVDAAIRSVPVLAGDTTDSRIAILTGVHRKDVHRLRQEPASLATSPDYAPMMSVGVQVVTRWISEQRYLTTHNKARSLARTPRHAQPGEPDFSSLVAEISSDVGAKAVLDELMRLGIVEAETDTHVRLHNNAFVPQNALREQFHFLASHVSDHLATAVHNLKPDRQNSAMLEQSAFAENLSADDAAELERAARHLWTQAQQQFLQKAAVAEKRSSQKAQATQRVRMGVYFHQTEMPTAQPTVRKTASKASTKRSAPRKKANQ
jgi:Family of unknown function (DUF6502)